MADKKISALTAASTPLAGTEVLPIVQGASTVKVAVSDLTAGRAVSATSVAAGLGLVGTPAYTFAGDLNTGVWSPAADTVAVSTAGAERVRVTDVGNVGFGTVSPAAYAGYTALTLEGATNGAALALRNNPGTVTAELAATPTETYFKTVNSLPLTLGTNNAERIRISATGDVTVNTGNLVVGTAAKGIDFSANTGAAGMTSELLDWYEEGTWTPSVGGDATYYGQVGNYTRVGNKVYVSGSIIINVLGTGSASIISGLPFAATNAPAGFIGFSNFSNLALAVTFITGYADGASTITILSSLIAATSLSSNNVIGNSTRLDFAGTYLV